MLNYYIYVAKPEPGFIVQLVAYLTADPEGHKSIFFLKNKKKKITT